MASDYKHFKVNHRKRFSNGKVYINGIGDFLSFSKERLIKFHGVSKEYFQLYLKEI